MAKYWIKWAFKQHSGVLDIHKGFHLHYFLCIHSKPVLLFSDLLWGFFYCWYILLLLQSECEILNVYFSFQPFYPQLHCTQRQYEVWLEKPKNWRPGKFSQKIHISLWIFVCIFCWRPTYMWSLINITKNAFEENSYEVVGQDGCCFLGKTFISIIMCKIYAMLVLKHLYQFAFTQLLCRESNKNMTLKMNRSKHEHSTYDLKP